MDSAHNRQVENVIVDDAAHSEEDEDEGFVVDDGAQEPVVTEKPGSDDVTTDADGEHGTRLSLQFYVYNFSHSLHQ